MKKINLFLLLFLFSTQAVLASSSSTDIPPLPALDPKHEQIAILTLEKEMSHEDIHHLVNKYRDLQLRKIYKYALKGFSVKGPTHILDKLAKETPYARLSIDNQYKVSHSYQPSDNMQIIGGRGSKGNT